MADVDDEKRAASNSSSSGPGSANGDELHKHSEKPLQKFTEKKDKEEEELLEALKALPEHEQQVIKRQIDAPTAKLTYFSLFRYSTKWDKVICCISAFCAIGAGAVMPLMTIIFGNLAGTFQGYFLGTTSQAEFNSGLTKFTLYFVYLGVGEFILVYICTAGFIYTGDHITRKIREEYLAAILRQNIGFFDKLGAGEITTRITSDTNLIQDGLSDKIGLTLYGIAGFVTAIVIGYVKSAKLSGILSSLIVGIVVVMGVCSNWMVKWNKAALDSYALGGTVAEEVISSIRNAVAFGTQDKLARQYEQHLKVAAKWGLREKQILGFMLGFMMLFIYLMYALAFWQGSKFLVEPGSDLTLSDILTVLLAIMIGAFSLGNVGPFSKSFATATAAAHKIFSTIERESPLDPKSDKGEQPDTVEGDIELTNIRHIYPSRPEVVVMEDVSLFIPKYKSTALVGASGCGKSTIVGLIERWYDPVGGMVSLDGRDIRDLNLHFLRRHMSLVSQEPTLFSTTIFKNIAHGLLGTEWEKCDDVKRTELVEEAARMANAHDFICALPEGYETNVGERGFLMSGGQKQRIAIARAVVSDPKILLLDEATSALDTRSEGVVQAALDKAAKGRTTIVIAHRLSTIKHADNIVVMKEGRIIEQGTHDQLLENRSAYYNLVEAQHVAAAKRAEEFEEAVASGEVETNLEKVETHESAKGGLIRTTTSKSVSSAVLKKQPTEKKRKYSLWTLIKVVGSFNKTEWGYMLIGLFFSIIAGGGHPTQAVFFAKGIVALTKPPSEYGLLRHEANFWSLMFLMLALVLWLAYLGQGVAFAYCSERLVYRARDQAFRTMLRQDIEYFDKDENSAGALTSFLSTQTTYLAGLSGSTLGTILNTTTTLVAAFALSLAIGWKLALVCISTVPVLLGCGFLRFWMLARFEANAKAAYEKSAGYASEAVSAIRTVASLTREDDVWEEYHNQLVAQGRRGLRSNLRNSALYACSQSFILLCFALGFWYGGTLIGSGEYSLLQFFIVFSAVIFGAQSAGTIFSFAPDMGKAKHAANELKTLFDRRPAIDTWSSDGKDLAIAEGSVEFREVHFRYPTRPEVPVLKGLNLSVSPGQYIALVGPSGCGKSTTISLLERFYSPLSGTILVDGQDITTLNVNSYRSHLSLVSQEPTLYQGNIRENILLGADRSDVAEEEIIQACKDANIYNFIISLPDGFETVVGNKGVMLSGGQKQRIAIARALIRDPKILLLDEATSALDSESEKVVQAALDNAAKGRTTIAVAHRLSTIQGADCIFVFEGGVIAEKGTHAELMRKRGRYFELVELQSLEKIG